MKVYAEVSTRGVVDVICTKCKKSTKRAHNSEYATLEAWWGFESRKDLERHESHLCEDCYDELLKVFGLTPEVTEYPPLG